MQNFLFDPDSPANRYWSVSSLTRHLKDWIESDTWLNDCSVQGEISNLSRPSSGHIYFTLKDAGAQLRCVMWRTQANRQQIPLSDGILVEVHGQITVYEMGGQYQLIADSIRLAGEGQLYQEYIQLKKRLEEEGLFDSARKLPIPEIPGIIGIITSPNGAAIQDMLHTIARRFPLAEVIVAPAVVQGEDAPQSLLAALQALVTSTPAPDVILLARGGGSIEDLWCFNDEELVRAVATCPIPIITGVGHETDFTLVDFASSLRAPTPTAAAELATPDRLDLQAAQNEISDRLTAVLTRELQECRQQVQQQSLRLARYTPDHFVNSQRQYCDQLLHRLEQSGRIILFQHRQQVQHLSSRLNAASPTAVLERGFSIVQRADNGALIRSERQVQVSDLVNIHTGDGNFQAVVKSKGSL